MSGWRLIVAIVLVSVLGISGGVTAARTFLAAPPTAAASERQPLTVRLEQPSLQSRARTIEVGGVSSRLHHSGRSATTVAVSHRDAAGVAFVRDPSGAVVASAPVWNQPGLTRGAPTITCDSTAFDRFLLTPGLGVDRPVEIDVLWAMSTQAPVEASLHRFGRLLCASEARSGVRASETDAAVTQAQEDYERTLFARVESVLATRAGDTRALGPSSTITLASSIVRSETDADCEEGEEPVERASSGPSAVSLCGNRDSVSGTNTSAMWQFVYPASGATLLSPILTIEPQRVEIPTLSRLLLDLAEDVAQNVGADICRQLGNPDVCKDGDRLQKDLSFVEAGEDRGKAANGYVAVGYGGAAEGDTTTALTAAEQGTVEGVSLGLSLVTQGIMPIVWLVLDVAQEKGKIGDTHAIIQSVLDASLLMPVAHPASAGDLLDDLLAIGRALIREPEFLEAMLTALAPKAAAEFLPHLAEQLGEYLVGLAIPGVDAAMVVKLVSTRVLPLLNLALSWGSLVTSMSAFAAVAVWDATEPIPASSPATPRYYPLSRCGLGDNAGRSAVLKPLAPTTTGLPDYALPAGLHYVGIAGATEAGGGSDDSMVGRVIAADVDFDCAVGGYFGAVGAQFVDFTSSSDPSASATVVYNYGGLGDEVRGACDALAAAGDGAALSRIVSSPTSFCPGEAVKAAAARRVIPVPGTTASVLLSLTAPSTGSRHWTIDAYLLSDFDTAAEDILAMHAPLVQEMRCSEADERMDRCVEMVASWTQQQLRTDYSASEPEAIVTAGKTGSAARSALVANGVLP